MGRRPPPSQNPGFDVSFHRQDAICLSQNTREQTRDYIATSFLFGEDPEWLTCETSLLEAGVIDSTGILELIGFIETEFGLTVEDVEVLPENLDSIENVQQFLERKNSA